MAESFVKAVRKDGTEVVCTAAWAHDMGLEILGEAKRPGGGAVSKPSSSEGDDPASDGSGADGGQPPKPRSRSRASS